MGTGDLTWTGGAAEEDVRILNVVHEGATQDGPVIGAGVEDVSALTVAPNRAFPFIIDVVVEKTKCATEPIKGEFFVESVDADSASVGGETACAGGGGC